MEMGPVYLEFNFCVLYNIQQKIVTKSKGTSKTKPPLFQLCALVQKDFFFLNKVIKVTYELTCKRVYCT